MTPSRNNRRDRSRDNRGEGAIGLHHRARIITVVDRDAKRCPSYVRVIRTGRITG